MTERTRRWTRRIGFALGVVAVTVALGAWRVPGGTESPGADVMMSVGRIGELDVSPVGPFVQAVGLRPGDEANGAFTIRNVTGTDLHVRIRTLPSVTDLDDALQVVVAAGDRPLFQGPIGELRSHSTAVPLAPGEERRISVGLRLEDGPAASRGRVLDAPIELVAVPS